MPKGGDQQMGFSLLWLSGFTDWLTAYYYHSQHHDKHSVKRRKCSCDIQSVNRRLTESPRLLLSFALTVSVTCEWRRSFGSQRKWCFFRFVTTYYCVSNRRGLWILVFAKIFVTTYTTIRIEGVRSKAATTTTPTVQTHDDGTNS